MLGNEEGLNTIFWEVMNELGTTKEEAVCDGPVNTAARAGIIRKLGLRAAAEADSHVALCSNSSMFEVRGKPHGRTTTTTAARAHRLRVFSEYNKTGRACVQAWAALWCGTAAQCTS